MESCFSREISLCLVSDLAPSFRRRTTALRCRSTPEFLEESISKDLGSQCVENSALCSKGNDACDILDIVSRMKILSQLIVFLSGMVVCDI